MGREGSMGFFLELENILALREEVRQFIQSKLGDGQRINFWFDLWALNKPFSSFCSRRYSQDGHE